MDLRVEITIPPPAKKHNGFLIDTYAVDAIGTRHEVEEAFWKETHICAMLRLIDDPPTSLRPIRIKNYLYDPVAESAFLSLCSEYFLQGRKLGNPDNGYSLYGIDCSNNLLTSTLCKYFIQHNRYEHMLSFFENFTSLDPVSAVPIAYAEARLDRSSRALSLLDGCLRCKPDSCSIMLSIAELGLLQLPFGLDRHIKLLDILKTNLNGISLQPNLSRGWWILAQCLIEMGRYEWVIISLHSLLVSFLIALVVMNNAPVVNEEFALRPIDICGNPQFEKITSPEFTTHNIYTVLQDEEKAFRDEPGDTSLKLLAAPNITPDEKTVYSLLSDIISRSSWDHLTKIRTRVLVRPAEMVRAKNRFMKDLQDAPAGQRTSIELTDHKDEAKASTEQQSAEFSPSVARARAQAAEDAQDSKDDTEAQLAQQEADAAGEGMATMSTAHLNVESDELRKSLDSSTENLASEGEVELPKSDKRFSSPTFSISRDLDIDDVLTQFLVYVLSMRKGIPVTDIPTTPMNIEVASSPMIPVSDISRNMDVAFHAIFQDIKAFHAWKEEEKKLGLVGLEDIPQKFAALRSVADWIRIASMCERLSFSKDANRIYKMLEHQHIRALGAIVGYDAERGDIKSTLMDASNLLSHYSSKYHAPEPHPLVVNAIVKLIASQGLTKVHSMLSSLPSLHPLLASIVQDTVHWKSKGFDARPSISSN
eukprot:Phypoly_transcript_02614.p1 GENE.Phypoly_transcript_02614~~Phypoly_transcript_02614.p1  ORF type:complete len:705 (+),score=95.79 Phypoly_transcript_02614:499-2613(+)